MITAFGTITGIGDAPLRIVRTPSCMVCGDHSVLTLDALRVDAYLAGQPVQVAFADMTADERELLISGTHPSCWTRLFA